MDGMGVRTRFYRPRGLALDPSTQSLYVADSYNHRVRLVGLTDVLEEDEETDETPLERVGRALQQNFVFILSCVLGSLGLALVILACCRYFPLCPMAQRRLHEKRLRTMQMGSRA